MFSIMPMTWVAGVGAVRLPARRLARVSPF